MKTAETAQPIPASRARRPPTVILTIRRGPNTGARFIVNNEITEIGRSPAADIMLDDITVTRRHAQLLHTEVGYRIVDLGSLNGTYVNKERLHSATLKAGDDIQVGKFTLTLQVTDTQTASATGRR